MTNAELTKEVVKLMEHQAKAEAQHEKYEMMIAEILEDVKSTKALAEDVHIMAINMQNMQKAMEENNSKIEETNKKVDMLSSKEFREYKENKKLIKQSLINKGIGVLTGAILTGIAWLITSYIKGGM